MKLKKLEITGFKSFGDKIKVDFPPGISGIIGPNGCGKSNIVDALRWVMGEQSAKQLRGKSMEDVIFAGANGKQPLNMAEVSITLENNNGSAPEELKDFSEIMLTRRLFRSGESGYFINKQACRLKDIHNVFYGSGLGSKSYSVIQQGNIGAITESGPDERRAFIEEAAGVTRYKSRKNEALNKLEATRQNLVRLDDIIYEVDRQLKALRRQARKAERYKSLQNRIKNHDVRLSACRHAELAGQIEETETLLAELNQADMEHTSRLRRLDAAVEQIKLERWQKNQEISKYKSDKFETQRRIDKTETDLSHLKKEAERLSAEADDLAEAQKDLEAKTEKISLEIQEAEALRAGMTSRIDGVRASLDRENAASQQLRDRLAELNREREDRKARYLELASREAQYRNTLQNALSNRENIQRRLKRTDEEAALASDKAEKSRGNVSTLTRQLDEIRQDVQGLTADIDKVKARIDEKSRQLSGQVKQVQSLDIERNKVKSQHAALKKMADNYEWYKDGVKAVMKARDSEVPELEGILGVVADALETRPEYEAAVESVLGESLQYLMVRDHQAGMKAVEYLRAEGAGRCGFIPVADVRPDPCIERTAARASENRLADHVSARNGYQPILDALIGNVTLAEDLAGAAARFADAETATVQVTPDGDILTPVGVLIGGGKDKSAGILSKKQEIRSLGERLSGLDEEIAVERETLKQYESEIRDLESGLQKQTEEKNRCLQAETEIEKSLFKAEEELKLALRHLDVVQMESEQLRGEVEDIDEQTEKFNAVLKEIADEAAAAQNAVSEIASGIETVSRDMETYNRNIVDLKMELTALNARLENTDQTLKRLREFHSDGAARLQQLSEDIAAKRRKAAEAANKIGADDQALSRMYEDLARLEETLENSESSYRTIDESLKEKDDAMTDIQQAREETLKKSRMLELEQSQRRIKRENIESRLQERYGKTLAELRSEGAPDQAGLEEKSVEELEAELARCREKAANLGEVNVSAIKEYEELTERNNFLQEQRGDIVKAMDDLHKVIKKINAITQERFLNTFNQVNDKLQEVFPRLFEGGVARLELTQPDKPLETGVEFMVHPPGKKLTRLSLLSGGEKALAAIAFIFSIFLIRPASFCIMDEIDAPLDEANVLRFNELLRIIREQCQIIMITHKKRSMELADTLFGVTMEQKGISKIVSVNFNGSKG